MIQAPTLAECVGIERGDSVKSGTMFLPHGEVPPSGVGKKFPVSSSQEGRSWYPTPCDACEFSTLPGFFGLARGLQTLHLEGQV